MVTINYPYLLLDPAKLNFYINFIRKITALPVESITQYFNFTAIGLLMKS